MARPDAGGRGRRRGRPTRPLSGPRNGGGTQNGPQDEAHIDGAAGCCCATCWPARPPRSLALRVRDVEPRGGDALRGRALHPPPGAGRRARHAKRSSVTPAPPQTPRRPARSAATACPCRRRRAARRASHAPHGRLSAGSVGIIRQLVIVVCVCAMRRSSDIGMVPSIAMVTDIAMVACIAMVTYIAMVPYIAMVASIWRVASIGRVASRLGESVPSVAEGIRPPPSRGRPRPASVLTGRARRASGRRTGPARCVAGGGIGLLRHAGVEAGCAPHARRPSLEQPLNRRVTAAPIMPYNSRYKA